MFILAAVGWACVIAGRMYAGAKMRAPVLGRVPDQIEKVTRFRCVMGSQEERERKKKEQSLIREEISGSGFAGTDH